MKNWDLKKDTLSKDYFLTSVLIISHLLAIESVKVKIWKMFAYIAAKQSTLIFAYLSLLEIICYTTQNIDRNVLSVNFVCRC